jgi:metallo-beta-lactamase family protein
VGRAQSVLYLLSRLRAAGRLGNLPVYVDSPLATEATRIFAAHGDLLDSEARDFAAGRGALFSGGRTTFVAGIEESKALNGLQGPAVIVSSSGMCEAGRVLHHLRHGIGDARNTILFVGYQAEHTLGRRILEKQPEVRIFGEPHRVLAEVAKLNGLSAHADRGGIAAYLGALGSPRRVFLVHGDLERCEALRQYLAARGHHNAEVPEQRQRVDLAELAR